MAQKILILGESGTGKTTSLRNLNAHDVAIVNPVGKALPFKAKFDSLDNEVNHDKIIAWISDQISKGKTIIIIDDFQYLLSIPYMHRIRESGWDKWNDFGENYFKVIDACNDFPNYVRVYFMSHSETLDNGITTIKLIGNLLREKITIEGLFTTVLRTQVVDNKYYFVTQNSGKDTVKSPLGLFNSYAIDNDLNYVDDKICNYYEIGDFKSNDEIAKFDKIAEKKDIEKPVNGRRSRKTEKTTIDVLNEIIDDDDLPFESSDTPTRRSRKVRE